MEKHERRIGNLKILFVSNTISIGGAEQQVLSTAKALNQLKDIKGSITFMGLSPNNDNHIISSIQNNDKIDLIEYYYFDKSEGEIVKSLFENKKVLISDIKEFWDKTTSP